MRSTRGNPSRRQEITLEVVIVEQILQTCISQASRSELRYILSEMWPSISIYGLGKYLFYLIEFDPITYNGKNQVFVLTEIGLDLLHMIKKEKEI
jgi:predicted transcriptional regulator